MNRFIIHPSLRFVPIEKILTSDSIKLDGEGLALEKEYTKILRTFSKDNIIKPKNWDTELMMKEYFEMQLDQYEENIHSALQKINTKIRWMFYIQALLGILALFFLLRSQFIIGTLCGTIAIIWLSYLLKNKSILFNKKLAHEKKLLQKKIEKETKERQKKKENFVQSEEERINTIKKILAYDEKATTDCLADALRGLELPFALEGSLSMEKEKTLLTHITLPSKSIIPIFIREKKKKKREKLIDEQYLEVLSRTFVLLINILYNTIPWLDRVEIQGDNSLASKKKQLVLIKVSRENFRAMNFALENPFAQLHNVSDIQCELDIDTRINIKEILKKEDTRDR